jgi:hypothetical protein
MKRILCPVLLAIFWLACACAAAAQNLPEVPKVEYANDLSELRLRRVYVYSADPVSRQAVVKQLRRERGLLDIVERAEDADYLLVYEGPVGEGADPFSAASAGLGRATATGTLVAYRLVEGCDGVRTRVLFATRKTKTVHGGIPLPLTPLSRGAFGQSDFAPRPSSGKRLGAELAARGALFLIGKIFPDFLRANPLEGSVALSFSGTPEAMVVGEFIERVKEARKARPPLYAGLMPNEIDARRDGGEPPMLGTAAPAAPGEVAPCQTKPSPQSRTDGGQDASPNFKSGDDTLPSPGQAIRPRSAGRAPSGAVPR